MAASVRDYLVAQRKEKLDEAAKITKEASAAARGLEDHEKTAVQGLLEAAENLKGKIDGIDEADAYQKQIDDMAGPFVQEPEEVTGVKSIGEAFVKSANYQSLMSAPRPNKWSTGPIEWDAFGEKAVTSTVTSAVVPTDYRAGIFDILSQPPTVSSRFAQATTDSNVVNYIKETVATNAAAFTSEMAEKPESTLTFANATANVRKVATFLPVSDEMLEDVSQIRSYLDSRLSLFVRQAEDSGVLNGNGTAPNILGVLNAGIHTANATALVADNAVDAFYQAITTIRDLSYLEPDTIIMHPTDWAVIRLLKDDNEQYYGGGPFTGAYGNGGIAPNNIWGLPVILTTTIAVNTALVGAFQLGGTVYRKSGLTVEASNSHNDWFRLNMTAIRAETRLALAIHRPQAFFKITNLDDTFS